MKRFPFLTILFLIASPWLIQGSRVAAQCRQTVLVEEYTGTSRRRPLPGVTLEVKFANSGVSDKSGLLTLHFPTRQRGERVECRRIEKPGYEIFNKEALAQWCIDPSTPFRLVMCRTDRFKQLCDLYSATASRSYRAQYDRERRALARLRRQGRIQQAEYFRRLRSAEAFYEKQLDNLQNYVDRFARIDLSEISARERHIIRLVQKGRINEAIAAYNRMDIVPKLLKGLSQKSRIDTSLSHLNTLHDSIATSTAALLKAAGREVDLLVATGGRQNMQQALRICSTIADLDTTDTYWRNRAASLKSKIENGDQ